MQGAWNDSDLIPMRQGVMLKDSAHLPTKARCIAPLGELGPHKPPVRSCKTVPDSWLEITIGEGRNRQVSRMTAAIGFTSLGLIRARVRQWLLGDLASGTYAKAMSGSN